MKEIPKIKAYRLYENRFCGDDYEYRTETSEKGMYFTRAEAEKEKTKLEQQAERKAGNNYDWQQLVNYYIKPEIIEKEGLEYFGERPENFIPFSAVKPIKDVCGIIRELYASQNLSLAYVNLSSQAKEHKHSIMEEVYYVTKGKGNLTLDDKTYHIEEGDTISIPKETWHFLKTEKNSELELLVVTHPRFMPEDVILKEK